MYTDSVHIGCDPVVQEQGPWLFVEKGDTSKLPVRNEDRVRRVLALLNDAKSPQDMNLSGMFFHRLHGNRWSVRVTGNWRITFDWHGLDAIDVDIEDYH